MGNQFIFQMLGPFRQELISNHIFYVEQARKRLLSQFGDISGEADKFADEWLSKTAHYFDPDLHDPEDSYEQAYDESITFYGLLTDMHDQTRLSVIAGMYHEWDKQLRDWLSLEIRKSFAGEETRAAIWGQPFSGIFDMLECFDWKVRAQPYFAQLDICRLVVNVYKHGLGKALAELKKDHPQFLEDFFRNSDNPVWDHCLNPTPLKITDAHLSAFSDAIIAFWNDVPENALLTTIAPKLKWLSKAIDKDLKT
jgi:hypothetical protein